MTNATMSLEELIKLFKAQIENGNAFSLPKYLFYDFDFLEAGSNSNHWGCALLPDKGTCFFYLSGCKEIEATINMAASNHTPDCPMKKTSATEFEQYSGYDRGENPAFINTLRCMINGMKPEYKELYELCIDEVAVTEL